MKVENIKNSNYIISESVTIKDAMVAITDNRRGTVAVVDENFHLIGVISDGDIRRNLIKGISITAIIKNIVNYNPVSLYVERDDLEKDAQKIFMENAAISLIPVIDSKNELVSIYIRD